MSEAKVIERILEFSAEAQIERRKTAPGSPAFRHLTGVIAAYGEILRTMSTLQRQQERYGDIARQTCRSNEAEPSCDAIEDCSRLRARLAAL
jgi:hypothetical protein